MINGLYLCRVSGLKEISHMVLLKDDFGYLEFNSNPEHWSRLSESVKVEAVIKRLLTNEEAREEKNRKARERRKVYGEKEREMQRERYATDEEYRKRKLETFKKSYNKRKK